MKKKVINKILNYLFKDVDIVDNCSRVLYSLIFVLVISLGLIGFKEGEIIGYFNIFVLFSIVVFFIFLLDKQISNTQGYYELVLVTFIILYFVCFLIPYWADKPFNLSIVFFPLYHILPFFISIHIFLLLIKNKRLEKFVKKLMKEKLKC